MRTKLVAAVALLASALLASSARADVIILKNGDRMTGVVKQLADGKLQLETPYAGVVTFGWDELTGLKTEEEIKLHLKDGTQTQAKILGVRDGKAKIRSGSLDTWVTLADITAINPPVKPPVVWSGFMRAGATFTDGNTRNREVNAAAQVTGRSDSLRLFLRGNWSYGEDQKRDVLIKRNALGQIKLDFFLTQKLYAYAEATFLSDKFQDLDLRSIFGAGLGYQWVEESWISFFTEAGLAYVVDNRNSGKDTDDLTGRLAMRFDWRIIENVLRFNHSTELLLGMEDDTDWLLNTESSLFLTITGGFFASATAQHRYDNSPTAGVERTDAMYIIGVGYEF